MIMEKTLLVYLSGKISGLPDLNKPKFVAAADLIKWSAQVDHSLLNQDAGTFVHVIIPHELPDHHHDKSWASYMRECVKAMTQCEVMYVLDDWKDSKGALCEVFIAKIFGIPIYEVETLDKLRIGYLKLFVKLLLKLA